MLIQTYAGLRQSAGHVVEYLALMEEAVGIARRRDDAELPELRRPIPPTRLRDVVPSVRYAPSTEASAWVWARRNEA